MEPYDSKRLQKPCGRLRAAPLPGLPHESERACVACHGHAKQADSSAGGHKASVIANKQFVVDIAILEQFARSKTRFAQIWIGATTASS